MALDREDMERRRQKREAARRRARKRKQKTLLLALTALVVLTGCGVVIYRLANGSKTAPVSAMNTPAETTASTTQATEATEAGRRTRDPITTIHIRAVGDLNITNSVVDSGIAATGYDYTGTVQRRCDRDESGGQFLR